MKQRISLAALGISALLTATPAFATNNGSPKEAEEMVRRAVALAKAEGPEKAYAAIMDKNDARFHDRDLYITVYDTDGNCLAHGLIAGMVGRNNIDMQDADGKFFVRERVAATKAGQPFNYELKFMSPTTKKIEDKRQYCEVVNNTSVCAGFYKY